MNEQELYLVAPTCSAKEPGNFLNQYKKYKEGLKSADCKPLVINSNSQKISVSI